MTASRSALALALLAGSPAVLAAPEFVLIEPSPGAFGTFGLGLSGDGSFVVGRQAICCTVGRGPMRARWRVSHVAEDLPGGSPFTDGVATAASFDGSVVVGYATNSARNPEAFRWTSATGMVGLGFLASGPFANSRANDVSADGAVVIGWSVDALGRVQAFWKAGANPMMGLDFLPHSGTPFSEGHAISGAATRVVGRSSSCARFGCPSGSDREEGFLWQPPTGPMTGVGFGPGSDEYSQATGISADGSTAVGFLYSGAGSGYGSETTQPVTIDVATSTMQLLGGTCPAYGAAATDASADGRIITGNVCLGSGFEAAVWTARHGWRSIRDRLAAAGIFVPPNLSLIVEAISDDGRVVAGTAINANTEASRAFVAELPPDCVADVDDGTFTGTPDGGVTIDDLLYYLFIFDQGFLVADVDDGTSTGTPDGGVTIDDLLYYLFRFDQGC